MIPSYTSDLDYLATRLHARRSRLAEAQRLDALCRLRSVPELGHAVFPGLKFSATADFQRQLARNLVQELSESLKHVAADARDFVIWLRARFQMENLKVLLRGFLNRIPFETLEPHLVELPDELALDAAGLMSGKSVADFAASLPEGSPRDRVHAVIAAHGSTPPAFILEAALDAGYFQELLSRTGRLPRDEREIVRPMIFQETDLFQFMLAARGRFHFGFNAATLLPLRVDGSGTSRAWFAAVMAAPTVLSAAELAAGTVIDALPEAERTGDGQRIELSVIEALAWKRYLRLANGAFRRSHMGVGAVAGYFGVRRMEIANLNTLSEGLRLGVPEKMLRARMITHRNGEVAHV